MVSIVTQTAFLSILVHQFSRDYCVQEVEEKDEDDKRMGNLGAWGEEYRRGKPGSLGKKDRRRKPERLGGGREKREAGSRRTTGRREQWLACSYHVSIR